MPIKKPSAKNLKSNPTKNPATTRTTEHHYRLIATKSKGKVVLRQAYFFTVESNIGANGEKMFSSSTGKYLSAKHSEKLAKKLGWRYKRPILTYHICMSKRLEFASGYITRNSKLVRNLSSEDYAKLKE